MSKKLKRVFSAVTATALIGSSLVFSSAVSAEDTGVIFESEVEKIDGVENWTSIYETQLPGFSGDGFAYLTSKNIEFEVEAPEEKRSLTNRLSFGLLDRPKTENTESTEPAE